MNLNYAIEIAPKVYIFLFAIVLLLPIPIMVAEAYIKKLPLIRPKNIVVMSLLLAVFLVMTLPLALRNSVVVEGDRVTVKSGFYSFSGQLIAPPTQLQRLSGDNALKSRRNGLGAMGLRSGHFSLRDNSKAFVHAFSAPYWVAETKSGTRLIVSSQ